MFVLLVVYLLVRPLVTNVYSGKTADWVEMPIGVMSIGSAQEIVY